MFSKQRSKERRFIRTRDVLTVLIVLGLGGCADSSTEDAVAKLGDPVRSLSPNAGSSAPDATIVPVDNIERGDETSGPCADGEQRPCESQCGVQVCQNGRWSAVCASVTEICNGHDDDCDENTDEDYESLGLGFGCSVSQDNGCESTGLNVCSNDGFTVVCNAEVVSSSVEVCDGVDNDCDGRIDEDFANQRCCTESAQCSIGQTCQNGLCSGGSNGGSTDGGSNGGSIGSESTCADNFDCDFLEVCDPISRQCRPRGSGSGCVDDFDCDFFADEVCDLNTNQCVPSMTGSGSGNSCSSDFDCGLFEVCDNGMCIEGCISDFDCAPGETCSFSGLCEPDFSSPPASFCDDARVISGEGTYTGSVRSGDQLATQCSGGGFDAVFQWQTSIGGNYTFDTIGSNFDTVLALYDDCDGSQTELVCDDDSGGFPESFFASQVQADRLYYIVVSGFDADDTGSFSLNIEGPPEPMASRCLSDSDCSSNELCLSELCVDVSDESSGRCGEAFEFRGPLESRSLASASDDYTASCERNAGTNDVAFIWRPSRNGEYLLKSASGRDGTTLSIWNSCLSEGRQLACAVPSGISSNTDTELLFSAQQDRNYVVVVSARNPLSIPVVTLIIGPSCDTDFDCASNELCFDGACQDIP